MHTKGKWKISVGRFKYGGVWIKAESEEEVCKMLANLPLKDNRKANAKRICQAVNSHDGLLDALKEALEWIYPMTDTLIEEREREKVIKRVQQEIAKTEE